jgi:transcriptional regulator with XRE-family HTH domain
MARGGDICVRLGRRIRELRKSRGWRQIDLAEHAGLNENYISDVELGRKEICLKSLKKIASGLGVPLAKLLDGL